MVHMFENATYGLADDLRFGLHVKHDVLQTPLGRKITEPVGRYKLPLLPRLPTASLSHQSAHGGGAEGSNEEVGERHHHVDSQRRVQEAQHVDQGSRLAQQPACRHTRETKTRQVCPMHAGAEQLCWDGVGGQVGWVACEAVRTHSSTAVAAVLSLCVHADILVQSTQAQSYIGDGTNTRQLVAGRAEAKR